MSKAQEEKRMMDSLKLISKRKREQHEDSDETDKTWENESSRDLSPMVRISVKEYDELRDRAKYITDPSLISLIDKLEFFVKEFFGNNVKTKFIPHFFPFTEPSAEVDIGYRIENNKIIIGEGDKWLEILGCGMVHPNVLKNCKVDPKIYQGFAFGIGIDRLAMLKYGINDLRSFFECDYRWLNYYGFDPLDVPTNYRGLSK